MASDPATEDTPPESRLGRIAMLGACIALAALHAHLFRHVAAFRFDDAYISLRYAENLAHHGVLSFNLDDRINGYTSPGWVLVLASSIRAGFDGEQTMLALSRFAGLCSAFASLALARGLGATRIGALGIAALGTLITPSLLVWSAPGMETSFVALVDTILVWVMLGDRILGASLLGSGRIRAAAMLLATVARPEGAVLAGACWCIDVALTVRAYRSTPAELRQHMAPMIAVAVSIVAIFAWQWAFYGHPLPNTFYAKSSTPRLVEIGISDALQFLGSNAAYLIPVFALAVAQASDVPRIRWVARAVVVWFLAVLIVYARSGGDFVGFHRFYQPLVPIGFAFTAAVVTRASRGRDALPIMAFAAWMAFSSIAVLERIMPENLGGIRAHTAEVEEYKRAGRALRPLLDDDDSVAVRAAGALPFAARIPRVIDTLALNNPEIAHDNPVVRDVPAHQKEATVTQLLAWRPDFLVAHPQIETTDLTGSPPAWGNLPQLRQAGYTWRCAPMDDGRFVCFWRLSSTVSASRVR